MEQRLTISFDDVEVGVANQYTSSLRDAVEREVDCKTEVLRSQKDSMDFGSILVLMLGTSAVSILAKGIADWLALKPEASITIKDQTGSIVAKGVKSSDVVRILKEWNNGRVA
jgi:hypothetical protein